MYYSAIGILTVLILLIENHDILLNRKGAFSLPMWKAYRQFLLSVLVYCVTDILWGVLESAGMAAALFADTTVYYIAMAMGILCWTKYTVTYLEEENAFGRLLRFAGRALAALVALLSLVNIFVPVLFTVDEGCVYHALPLRYVMLAVQVVMLLLISAYAASSRLHRTSAAEKKTRYLALTFFGLIMAIFLIAQYWYPLLPLYGTAYLLGTCLLHTFVVLDEKETYQRSLEEAARTRELKETISSLLDNMPGMSFTKDAETGVYLACNKAFAEYARKEGPEGVAGLTDAEMFDAETAARFAEDDRMALSMEEPFIFFEDVLDAEGNRRQLQTTRQKYYNASGQLCVLGMCQDVTDMVRIQRENATTRDAYEKARSTGIIYTHIAQTLAQGYTDLYYVNAETEEFLEYETDQTDGSLREARRGGNFFDECRAVTEEVVYPDDREQVIRALERRTLLDALARSGTIMLSYRVLSEKGPTYVSMRISRMKDDERFLVMGVTDVDEQVKQRRAAEQAREEQIAYARLNALTGDFLCVYLVVPETGQYREYSSSAGFSALALPKEGPDFFAAVRENSPRFIYPEDQSRFLSAFTGEGVLSEIRRSGIFSLSCRLAAGDKPVYVQLRAAMVEEKEGPRLVVGINDVDAQVRQEEEYAARLAQAQSRASVDALTGVKNRNAFLDAEEQLDRQIAEEEHPEFAVVILDVNDLKKVNDTAGHQAGDQFLRKACRTICEIFAHSPVYRIGGDEFAVISRGKDYDRMEELMQQVEDHNREARHTGGVVIACGMAKYGGEAGVNKVLERADRQMYANKDRLKNAGAGE